MKNTYLLDTHAVLWLLFDPSKLSPKVTKLIIDPSNVLIVSSASLWELSIKFQQKKLNLSVGTPLDLLKSLQEARCIIQDITAEETASFYQLPKEQHADPFDRMLVWQAIQKKYTLISKDEHLHFYKKSGLKIIW